MYSFHGSCHGEFRKKLLAFQKYVKLARLYQRMKAPCCLRRFGWKFAAKNFRPRRDFYKIISRYETLFLLCCWALPVQHFVASADNESAEAPSQELTTPAEPGSPFRPLWRRKSDLGILVRNYWDTSNSIYRFLWEQNADSYQTPFI